MQQKAPDFVPPQQDRDLDQDGYEKDSIWVLVTAKQIGLALLSLFILMKFFVWGDGGYQKIGSSAEAIAQYSAFKEMKSHPTPDLDHLRGLLKKGHYSKVESILRELHNNVIGDISWEIPFRQTVYNMSLEKNIRLEVLSKWVESTHSAYAYMVRGAYYTEAGYNARGLKYTSQTTPEQLSLYAKLHVKAHQDLLKAKSIDNSLLPLYSLLIITAKSSGSPIPKEIFLDKAIAINPRAYHYRYAYITHLKPRWGGSWKAMQQFVDETKSYFKDNPRLWILQGYKAADKGDIASGKGSYDDCISFFSEALQYGRHSLWLYERAYCLAKKRDFEKALKDVNMSLEMNDDKKEVKELKRYLNSKV
jgi:tetratricopeptide (TPR) repeat protein